MVLVLGKMVMVIRSPMPIRVIMVLIGNGLDLPGLIRMPMVTFYQAVQILRLLSVRRMIMVMLRKLGQI